MHFSWVSADKNQQNLVILSLCKLYPLDQILSVSSWGILAPDSSSRSEDMREEWGVWKFQHVLARRLIQALQARLILQGWKDCGDSAEFGRAVDSFKSTQIPRSSFFPCQ